MDDVRLLLPQDKFDLERAKALVALGYPAVAPVLLEMMEWVQDTNWPVADVIAPFLATIGTPLVPLIRAVFSTDDGAWKSRVMLNLVIGCRPIFEAVESEVRQMASGPARDEDEEWVQETALEVLVYFGAGLAA